MKQLYYTSCVAGRSVSGQGGFQIRAVSRGLADDRCRALLGHLSYRLPNGFDEDTPPADAPRRLALLNTNAGRVLVNSVHVGRDPTTGRAGNFFSHLLIDLPNDLDAGVAAALLNANFWVAADQAGPAELPDLETLPSAPTISPIKLSEFANANAELIRFLFQGLLSVTEHQRLFVVAPPDDVAKAVLVVARMLPRDLRAALTFSTYEREPLSSPARIVGTCWRDARLDLESVCYDGAGFGFNTLTRRCSQLSPPAPFAAFALQSLAEGRDSELAKFYAACGSMKLDTPERLELAYRVVNDPKPLSNREFSQAQAIPELARAISGREDTARNVVRWAIDDPQFRDSQFASVVRQAESPAPFYDEIAEQVVARLTSGDIDGAKSVLEQLPPKISRDAAAAVHERIGGRLESAALPAKARLFILPSLLRVKNVDARTRQRWLDMPAEHLADLLKLGIDPNDMFAACESALEKSLAEPDPTALAAVAEHPAILQRILDRHGGEETPRRRARDAEVADSWAPTIRELIAAALRHALDSPESGGLLSRGVKAVRNIAMTSYAPPAAMSLTRDLLDLYERRRLSETQFDDGLRQLFASSRFDPGGFLASTDYRRAAPQLEIGSLSELTRRALAESPVGVLDEPVGDLLRRCSDSDAERRLPKDTRDRLADLVRFLAFLERPALDSDGCSAIKHGLEALDDDRERQDCQRRVVELTVDVLLKASEPAEQLEELFGAVGGVPATTGPTSGKRGWLASLFGLRKSTPAGAEWVAWFVQLADALRATPEACARESLIIAVATIGLGGPNAGKHSYRTLKDDASREAVSKAASAYLGAVLKRIGRETFGELTETLQKRYKWTGEPLKRWRQTLAPPKKKPWFDYFLFVLYGAIVVVALFKYGLPFLGLMLAPSAEPTARTKRGVNVQASKRGETQRGETQRGETRGDENRNRDREGRISGERGGAEPGEPLDDIEIKFNRSNRSRSEP